MNNGRRSEQTWARTRSPSGSQHCDLFREIVNPKFLTHSLASRSSLLSRLTPSPQPLSVSLGSSLPTVPLWFSGSQLLWLSAPLCLHCLSGLWVSRRLLSPLSTVAYVSSISPSSSSHFQFAIMQFTYLRQIRDALCYLCIYVSVPKKRKKEKEKQLEASFQTLRK